MNESTFLPNGYGEAIVRLLESAPTIRLRSQFFYWTQGQLQTLLPHSVLVCGAYHRQQREVVFDVFNSIVLPPRALQMLGDGRGPLMQAVQAAWIDGRGRPLLLETANSLRSARIDAAHLASECDIDELLVHGTARPQRVAEIESLFLLAAPGRRAEVRHVQNLEILLPHLHATWIRVLCTEREREESHARPSSMAPSPAAAARPAKSAPQVTDRELQILQWVREGMSNHEIAAVLGISPLTVKNHIQKILRKLEASNRAQALGKVMALGLLGDGP
jgi:transcriptional regulator EpsA